MKRKCLALLLGVMLLFSLFACNLSQAAGDCEVLVKTENRVVYKANVDDATLLVCMENSASEVSFVLENGMVTAINGKKNAADFSSCWMLYTSDTEMSNVAWGTVEYEGKTLASAIVGAEAFTVKKGEIYLCEYTAFE